MSQTTAALDFKSANLYALRAVLRDADTARLTDALDAHMARAGSLFEGEPVILDASLLPADATDNATVDWPALVARLREHNLPVIGVVATDALRDAARAAGLTALELSAHASAHTARSASAATGTTPPADTPAPDGKATAAVDEKTPHPAPVAGMLITRPLRSGQRIYARGCDLTIVGVVSQGAEVLADGNIHVYGPLRGKAMAGARGNTQARIFTTQFDPELVAIAGVYHVVEKKLDPKLHNRPVQVWLADERLKIEAL